MSPCLLYQIIVFQEGTLYWSNYCLNCRLVLILKMDWHTLLLYVLCKVSSLLSAQSDVGRREESCVFCSVWRLKINSLDVLSVTFTKLCILCLVGTIPSYYAQFRVKGSASRQKYLSWLLSTVVKSNFRLHF